MTFELRGEEYRVCQTGKQDHREQHMCKVMKSHCMVFEEGKVQKVHWAEQNKKGSI